MYDACIFTRLGYLEMIALHSLAEVGGQRLKLGFVYGKHTVFQCALIAKANILNVKILTGKLHIYHCLVLLALVHSKYRGCGDVHLQDFQRLVDDLAAVNLFSVYGQIGIAGWGGKFAAKYYAVRTNALGYGGKRSYVYIRYACSVKLF